MTIPFHTFGDAEPEPTHECTDLCQTLLGAIVRSETEVEETIQQRQLAGKSWLGLRDLDRQKHRFAGKIEAYTEVLAYLGHED